MPYIIRKIKEANPKEITCGTMRKLTGPEDFSRMDFVHVTITSETKKHFHKTLTECYFVLKGSIEVDLNGKKEKLEEGALLMIHPGTKHKAWKTSEENAEILVACAPPWSEEDEILVE